MRLPLQREGWVTRSLANNDQIQLLSLAGLSLVGILLPMFGRAFLPIPVRTALIGVGVASSSVMTAVAYESATDGRQAEKDRVQRIQGELHKAGLTHDVVAYQMLQEAQAKTRMAAIIQKFPAQQRMALASQYGLTQFVSFPEMQQVQPANVVEPVKTEVVSGQVFNYEYNPPPEPVAAEDWITSLVSKFVEPDQSKRMYAHLIVNGPTKSGKSTLTSKLLALIAQGVASHGDDCEMLLIDPKYPKTDWPLKPAFRGYEMVLTGLNEAIAKFRERKKLCIQAEEAGKDHPRFSHFVVVVDEQDSIYAEGKGHPDLGGDREERKEAAQKVHSMEVNLLKEAAAYNVSLFVVGQSPLSGATGFSRSDMQQACRIVLGNEALKWLNDKEFPFKEDVPELQAKLKYWMDKGDRVALICPNIGRAYVEAIPYLEIAKIDNVSTSNSKPSDLIEDPWKDADPGEPIATLKAWIKTLSRVPTDEELIAKFKEIMPKGTGHLNANGLKLLKEKLGLV